MPTFLPDHLVIIQLPPSFTFPNPSIPHMIHDMRHCVRRPSSPSRPRGHRQRRHHLSRAFEIARVLPLGIRTALVCRVDPHHGRRSGQQRDSLCEWGLSNAGDGADRAVPSFLLSRSSRLDAPILLDALSIFAACTPFLNASHFTSRSPSTRTPLHLCFYSPYPLVPRSSPFPSLSPSSPSSMASSPSPSSSTRTSGSTRASRTTSTPGSSKSSGPSASGSCAALQAPPSGASTSSTRTISVSL